MSACSTSHGHLRMRARRLAAACSGSHSMVVMRELYGLVENRWFSLADLLLVAVSGLAWILIPKAAVWFTLLAFLPWGARLLAGRLPFHRTPFDALIAIFLITAWVGYWAAYDKPTAWTKAWLIVTAVLLYYALSGQPRQNLIYVSALSFCLALGISAHYYLTYDF